MMVKKTEVAVQQPTALVAFADDMMADAGLGFENVSAGDVAIPYLKVLQALSPELRGVTKIAGAEEGLIINTVTGVLMKEVRVIPCAFKKSYVEWTPREAGGGLVKEWTDEKILEKTKKNERNQDVLANGNLIVTTAYHYVLVLSEGGFERALIAMSSTQLKKSRRWLGQMMALQVKVGDKSFTPPPFSHSYHLGSGMETKDANSWYGWLINDPTMVQDRGVYDAAKKFGSDVTAGLVKVAEPPADAPATAGEEDVPY
jgi:hypothetical protein